MVPARREKKKQLLQWKWERTTFVFPSKRPTEQPWVRLPDRRLRRVTVAPLPPGIFQGMAYLPYLPTRSQLSADLEFHFDRRGRYSDDIFGLAIRFTFTFHTKTAHIVLPRVIIG